jgi:hypothetical protein
LQYVLQLHLLTSIIGTLRKTSNILQYYCPRPCTECDYDDEPGCSICIVYHDNGHNEDEDKDERGTSNQNGSSRFADNVVVVVVWLVLLALLFLQFGLSFCLAPVEATAGVL